MIGDSVLPFQQKSGIIVKSQIMPLVYFLMHFPEDDLQ